MVSGLAKDKATLSFIKIYFRPHFWADHEQLYLAYVTLGHVRGGERERDPLVLAGELVCCVNLLVAFPAQCCLVRAAQNLGLRGLAHVALNLHFKLFVQTQSTVPSEVYFLTRFKEVSEKKNFKFQR